MAKAKTRSRRQKRARRAANQGIKVSGRLIREVGALVFVVLAFISLLAIFTPTAAAGVTAWHDFLQTLLGWGMFFAPALLLLFALMLWMRNIPVERLISALGIVTLTLSLLGLFQLAIGGPGAVAPPGDGGGVIGTGRLRAARVPARHAGRGRRPDPAAGRGLPPVLQHDHRGRVHGLAAQPRHATRAGDRGRQRGSQHARSRRRGTPTPARARGATGHRPSPAS